MVTRLATWFRRQPVRRKLTATALSTSAVTLITGCVVFAAYDYIDARSRLVRDVTLLADMLGTNSIAPLTFNDATAAAETLRATAVNEHIENARLYMPTGALLASYVRAGQTTPVDDTRDRELLARGDAAVFDGPSLHVVRPIVLDRGVIGTISVQSDTTELMARARRFIAIVAGTVFGVFWIALLLSQSTARLIFRPIARLIDVTRMVRDSARYDVRAAPGDADEIGELIEQFNAMLADVEKRDQQLLQQQDGLERTVSARTAELQASNLQLIEMRDRAMEGSRAKSEFLANMSHEIRTPMNGILGMTELVLDSELTEEQRDNISTVKSSAESLLSILNDILDFSKIESRKLDVEAAPFALRAAVAASIKPFTLQAQQKGLDLICNVSPDVPAGVVGDSTRIQQVLTNLVGNALKFTEAGHVLVSVTESARIEGTSHLHFSISDTGIGIPADKHAAIFEAFRQADGSTTRQFGGTGLGLTISSTLVALMGGRIWVESEPGVGSTFSFSLNLPVTRLADGSAAASEPVPAPSAPRTPAPVAPPLEVAPGAPSRRILLVEDNIINQRVAIGMLTKRGHHVTLAQDGGEAVAILERERFDLVLMDLQMPGISGLDATAMIRRREQATGDHVRIIAMTARAMASDREQCLAAGMDGYLSKPIDRTLLFEAVEDTAPIHAQK
jgi:signal transduction histidine kinase/CheY-like chemotaxis protein